MNKDRQPGFETLCVHFAEQRQRDLGAAAPPLFQNSTFTFPNCEAFAQFRSPESSRYAYTRVANPTTSLLESKIAKLEGGQAARAFASGMAAISAAVLSAVKAGDHIITIETVYWPTRQFFAEYLTRFGITTTFVRGTEVEHFTAALRPNTRLIYLESPSSLLFELQDFAEIARLAKAHNIVTATDNSNATPYFQNPLRLGIDLVVHSATKYLGGHSDLVAGMIVGSEERIARIARNEGELLGGILDPFASWLMLRGLRTLAVRMERQQESALALAKFLESDARVSRVFYDGLESHPQAALAGRQMRGHSGMLSFELRDNSREQTYRVVDALKYFCIAVSWGGFESLVVPLEVVDPATGKKTWVIRLSVGLETVDDLKADLQQALGAAATRSASKGATFAAA